MCTAKNFINDMLSGRGTISAKRFLGLIMIVVSQICIMYLTIRLGNSSTVQSLIETNMIVGACLLGVTSVTGIWKRTGYMNNPYMNSSYMNNPYMNNPNDNSHDNSDDNQNNNSDVTPDPEIMNKKPLEPPR